MSRVLYCAEPIDQSDFGPWKESVAQFCRAASDRGWLVYRPSRAWAVGPNTEVGSELETINRVVLESAGAVVAHLPSGVPSVGTPRELEWAVSRDVPSLVVSDSQGSWSLHDVPVCGLGEVDNFNQWLEWAEQYVWGRTGSEFGRSPRPLQIVLDHPEAKVPVRANAGDAGYDLFVSQDVKIPPGSFLDVPCGFRMALPYGVWGRITGRSSTLRKRNLMVAEGVIDSGYRGPIYAGVFNLGDSVAEISKGDRIAQLLLHENLAPQYTPIEIDAGLFDRIPGDGRGTNGFGSSGS